MTIRSKPTRSLAEIFVQIKDLSDRDLKDLGAAGWKLMEEVGEFAETVNHSQGFLPHKIMKETPFGEAADVIQNILGILFRVYPEMTPAQIMDELQWQLGHKTDKWEEVLKMHPSRAKF
jgi:NTP pyrophosphatase (non-canonical NTP hydrolase)